MIPTPLTRSLAALASCAALASGTVRAQTPPAAETAPAPAATPAPAPAATPAPAPAATTATSAAAAAPAPSPEAGALQAPHPAVTSAPGSLESNKAAAASATAAPSTPPPVLIPLDEPRPKLPAPPTPLIDAWLGVHGLILPSPAYDAFSEDDALTSFTLGAGLALTRSGGTHIAAVASLSTAGAEGSYRQTPTELSVLRLTLGPELRFPFAGRFYAYGRVSPQLVQSSARLEDASAQSDLEEEEWLFGVDSAVGVSGRVGEVSVDSAASPVCFFVRAEAGYTWTPSSELELSAGAGAPIRSEALSLGDLSLSGISFRGAVGVGY